ncbi:MAG: hypothetical protein MJ180_01255 [Candidatus Gastranaerophilales bacterium]|nr:hypothetical protein [Candidatus Gastranaerophilales bacterium]
MFTEFELKNNPNATSPFREREENKILKIENMLLEVLKWNDSLDIPIITSLKNNALRKIIRCFFYAKNRPVAIGFAGESASGKTTIANEIIRELENFASEQNIDNFITKINLDNYYYDRSKEVIEAGSFDNFVKNYDLDSPSALELDLFAKHLELLKAGNEVYLPMYDMSGTAKRWDNKIQAIPSKLIITEGLYPFTEDAVQGFDIKFYVDIDEDVQKARWYRRAKERDLGESADRVYNNALSKAKIYIRPTKLDADVILNGEASIENYKIFIEKIMNVVRELISISNNESELELVRS